MVRRYHWTVFALLLLVLPLAPAWAQNDALGVEIEWPNHGETVYGGPSSLLYKIPIKGIVRSEVYALQDVTVELELYREGAPFATLQHSGEADGAFSFEVTVNPHASTEEFTIGFTDCGLLCHGEGEAALQPGRLLARVTATAPDGTSAQAERRFVVDIAGTATVPVQVVLAGAEQHAVAGVDVSAATWLYQWRARFGAAQTDAQGRAELRVEALSQVPTEYLLRIEPTVVDGVLYRGQEAVPVQLAPGATGAPTVQLAVDAFYGRIDGWIAAEGAVGDRKIAAIRLLEGECVQTRTTGDGSFVFAQLPVDQYLLAAVEEPRESSITLAGADRRYLDLTQQLSETARLTLTVAAFYLQGTLQNEEGRSLPFGLVHGAAGAGAEAAGLLPHSGQFFLPATTMERAVLEARAPGYYAAALPVTEAQAQQPQVLTLRPQPGTQALPWGSGSFWLPAGNVQQIEGRTITLRRGYLWGDGDDAQPFTIVTPAARISMAAASFALQVLDEQHSWLYVFAGEARVTDAAGGEVLVRGGQMLNLHNAERLMPVAYDPLVISALDLNTAGAFPAVWEPTPGARLRDALARLGVGTAQVVTFLTYLLIVISLVLAPLLMVWRRGQSKG